MKMERLKKAGFKFYSNTLRKVVVFHNFFAGHCGGSSGHCG